jgi:cyclic pyranopterin phosphate synthase
MTTNGQRLAELAAPLKRAGLRRLNVSLDSLDAARFRALTRRGDLEAVLAGIQAARVAGFEHTKINVVVMGGENERELVRLCAWSWQHGLMPRFIELMPMSDGELFSSARFVAAAEMRALIEAGLGPLELDDARGLPGVGPARYYRVKSGPFRGGRLGLISAVSEPFCETCNRVRLSATGQLHTCLALDEARDLRVRLRDGSSDEALSAEIAAAVSVKKPGHAFTACGAGAPRKHMVAIGG